MGVPVVSLVCDRIVGRAGLSQSTQLGLPYLATFDADAYVDTAVRLVRDLEGLAALRASLRGRMEASPLMDGPRFARAMEASYRRMGADPSRR
jgi:predicted O-linked N-acetylglucosamine transferase (SPINDLY family)